ncbi:protein YnhH [Phytobacter diazotrophicus]|uniref:protein YnhH n=1 Tax=Phytobacter diazotrophicus TaxID=395631 RepID=UPI003B58927B
MAFYSLLNGFSSLNCKTQPLHYDFPGWAETQAHITLHAFLMSPILRLWHCNFRNTGLTPKLRTNRSVISISFST